MYIHLLITNLKFSFSEINFFESGLSNHMIYTILKTKFEKMVPKKLIYRHFKQYDSDQFKLDNCNSMSAMRTHEAFKNIFFSILDQQVLRGNQKLHFNKNLR